MRLNEIPVNQWPGIAGLYIILRLHHNATLQAPLPSEAVAALTALGLPHNSIADLKSSADQLENLVQEMMETL